MMPSVATWLSGQLAMFQTHASCDVVAACAGLPYGLAEAVRLLQEVERPVLVVCGEKFSDKIETVANTSSASIPIALHDAIRTGVIDRPLRVFAPVFGAGAVGGYVVMRVDPAIAA